MSQAYTGTAGNDPSVTATAIDATARTVHYKCGDCDMDVPLKRGEPIRCRNCGHRVLYKQRTNRYVDSLFLYDERTDWGELEGRIGMGEGGWGLEEEEEEEEGG